MTVSDIARYLRFFASEGRAGSAESVLRLVSEQLRARSYLAQPPYGTLVCVLIYASTIVGLAIAGKLKHHVGNLVTSTILIAVYLTWDWQLRHRRARAAVQVVEIRRLALVALEEIIAEAKQGRRPLEPDLCRTLDSLSKSDSERWRRVALALRGES